MRRGVTVGEALVALAVVLIVGTVLLWVAQRSGEKARQEEEIARMRRVFLALTLYAEDQEKRMPGSLAELHGYADRTDLRSTFDPFAKRRGPYPVEPTLPEVPETAPYRISDAYLGNWFRLKRATGSWDTVTPDTAVLANVWQGRIQPGSGFQFAFSGSVLRIRLDGALAEVHAPQLSAENLFFRKEPATSR